MCAMYTQIMEYFTQIASIVMLTTFNGLSNLIDFFFLILILIFWQFDITCAARSTCTFLSYDCCIFLINYALHMPHAVAWMLQFSAHKTKDLGHELANGHTPRGVVFLCVCVSIVFNNVWLHSVAQLTPISISFRIELKNSFYRLRQSNRKLNIYDIYVSICMYVCQSLQFAISCVSFHSSPPHTTLTSVACLLLLPLLLL